MIIRNIEIYLDQVINDKTIEQIMKTEGWTRENAIRLEDQRYFNDQSRQLSREATSITTLFLHNLEMKNKPNCQINLCCRIEQVRTGVRWFQSIVEVDVPFNMEYFQLEEESRKKYILNLLTFGLKKLCGVTGWDYVGMEKAIQYVEDVDFKCEYYLKDKVTRNDVTARLLCKHTIDSMTVFAAFFRNKELIKIEQLFSSKPHIFDYNRFLGEFKWIDDVSVCLYSRDKTENFIAKVDMSHLDK